MTWMEVSLLLILLLCVVFLAAYSIGRRVGIRQGRHKAQATVPLDLRAEAYLLGRCPICDTISPKGVSG